MTGSSNPTPPSVTDAMVEAAVAAEPLLLTGCSRRQVASIITAALAARPNQEATRTVGDGEIETVARAICNSDGGTPDACPLGPRMPNWRLYEKQARAALTALHPSADDGVLREALRPFADHAAIVDAENLGDLDTPDFDGWSLLAGDFRKARAALSANPNIGGVE